MCECFVPATGPWTSAAGPYAHCWTVWSAHTARGPAPPGTWWSCFCRTDLPPRCSPARSQHTRKRCRWAGPRRATWLEPHKRQWRCWSTPWGSQSSSHGDKASWDWGSNPCRASRAWCWRTDPKPAELQLGPVRKLPRRRSSGCGCRDTEKRPLRRRVPLRWSEVPWSCSQSWLSGPWRSAGLSGSYSSSQRGRWQRFSQNKSSKSKVKMSLFSACSHFLCDRLCPALCLHVFFMLLLSPSDTPARSWIFSLLRSCKEKPLLSLSGNRFQLDSPLSEPYDNRKGIMRQQPELE